MKTKEKKTAIQEFLSEFEDTEVLDALAKLKEDSLPLPKTKDLDDPGPEVVMGEEGCVALEDLGPVEERIIARNNFLPVSFLEEGAIVQRAVARVAFRQKHGRFAVGAGWASGFMVSPTLFMTNNHVIPNKAFAKKLKAQFNYQDDISGTPLESDDYIFDPDDVFYTNSKLDFTLIRVKKKCNYRIRRFNQFLQTESGDEFTPNPFGPIGSPVTVDQAQVFDPLPFWWNRFCVSPGHKWGHIQLKPNASYALKQFLNIVQHPAGRRKELALQENLITNIYSAKIRYTTDTEGGSSGSPVFNNGWDLVAIHHAAGEWNSNTRKWVNNQGIRIDKIVAALKNHYGGTITGVKILTELGIS